MQIHRIIPEYDYWDVILQNGKVYRLDRHYVLDMPDKDYGNLLDYLCRITTLRVTEDHELEKNGFRFVRAAFS